MPPKTRLPFPDPPQTEDTPPVGPCAPWDNSDDTPPPVILPEAPETGDKVSEALDGVAEVLEARLREMVDGFNVITDAVRRFAGTGMLGPEIIKFARTMLDKLREIIEGAIDVVVYIMEHYAPLAALSLTSTNWLSHVRRPMSGLSKLVSTDSRENLQMWEGKAADAYRTKVTDQRQAVEHIGAIGADISGWLNGIFLQNLRYTKSLRLLLARLAAKLGAAAAKASTGFGIPEAIMTLADELDDILETSAGYVVEAVDRIGDAIDNTHALMDKLSNTTNLPDGRWPQAVRG